MSPRRVTAVRVAVPLALACVAAACASPQVPPRSLIEARAEFQRAKDGPAMQVDPTDVHEAEVALQRAEQAFRDAPDDPSTGDLAVVADRRALLAEVETAAIKAQQDTLAARAQLQASTASRLQNAEGQLGQTQQALGQTQMQLQQEQASSAAQAQELQDMRVKLKDTRDTIAKIAAVKDDDRGMVITLQGEVLFKTAKWDLKPAAMAKLDQIADALKAKEQRIAIYGYTDSVGAVDMNMELSQKRAAAVRDYLASRGVPQDLLSAQGKGPSDPVSDNGSLEGRAMNRRVEIVVQPKAK